MLILAFDTTVAACSVAVWRDGAVIAAAREIMDQGQAEALMPMIEGVMARAGKTYADLDRIAVTCGPGSFTGVRVGLATARGLGLAADKPVIGVMTTEVLAAAAIPGTDAQILAAVDTKRGDLYVQLFDAAMNSLSEAHVVAPGVLAAWLGDSQAVVVGDGAAAACAALGARAVLSSAAVFPDPGMLAQLAAQRTPTAQGPLPVYIRAPDATMPQHGGRLRP
jgi:tRNA threonylcarbamoyladenosine biosynthesis protein TsaB